jgi:hypothetical protein
MATTGLTQSRKDAKTAVLEKEKLASSVLSAFAPLRETRCCFCCCAFA